MNQKNRIRQLREKANKTQLDIANILGVNYSVMSRIESGERPLKDNELIILSEFFGVTIDYILGKTNVPQYTETFACHTDSEFTEEALAELENFKDYLRNKYKNKK